jgi:hypothetical protein
MSEIETYAEKDVQVMMIGNKADLTEEKLVDFEKARVIFNSNNTNLFFKKNNKIIKFIIIYNYSS